MKSIQVYDPPMFSTEQSGGTEPAQDVVNFAMMLGVLGKYGIQIERYNFGLQPQAFAQNAVVRVLLERVGIDVLPVMLWDGTVQLTGRYPTQDERTAWFTAASRSVEAKHA